MSASLPKWVRDVGNRLRMGKISVGPLTLDPAPAFGIGSRPRFGGVFALGSLKDCFRVS
jgi:hypothetical protein